jgi:hypothetical protein
VDDVMTKQVPFVNQQLEKTIHSLYNLIKQNLSRRQRLPHTVQHTKVVIIFKRESWLTSESWLTKRKTNETTLKGA